MLSFEENGWNFQAFKILSLCNVLPIQVELETGKIRKQTSAIRIFLWKTYFTISVSHGAYILLRLVQSTMVELEKLFRWNHFVIHYLFVVTSTLFNFIGYRMFVVNPEECVLIFNQLFVQRENLVQKIMDEEKQQKGQQNVQLENQRENEQEKEKDPERIGIRIRPLLTWPPQYALDELVTRFVSFSFFVAGFFVLVILAADPSRLQLVYSALPPQFQNAYTFLGLFPIEIVATTIIVFSCLFSVAVEGLFFGKCEMELRQLNSQLRNFQDQFQSGYDPNIRREVWTLRQILKEIKELVLFIEHFNRCFPPCIFAYKLLCISVSILFFFFTIRHSHDFPFLGVFTGYIATLSSVNYAVLYQNAFSIPQKTEEFKREFLIAAQKTVSKVTPAASSKSLQAEMKRKISGIRNVGVKVGSFHTLERESTPIFMDFVFQNVVNLLVTFPR